MTDEENMEQRLILCSERLHREKLLASSELVADAGLMIQSLAKENAKLLEGIRYWSYCTSEGMRTTAPEKCDELMGFLMGCKIAPYYMPKE